VLRPSVAVLRPPRSHHTPRLSDPAAPQPTARRGGSRTAPTSLRSGRAGPQRPRNASANRGFRPFAALRVAGWGGAPATLQGA